MTKRQAARVLGSRPNGSGVAPPVFVENLTAGLVAARASFESAISRLRCELPHDVALTDDAVELCQRAAQQFRQIEALAAEGAALLESLG